MAEEKKESGSLKKEERKRKETYDTFDRIDIVDEQVLPDSCFR